MGPIIILMFVGLILLLAEIFLLPGFIVGSLGLCSFGAACWLGFEKGGQLGGTVAIIVSIALITAFVVWGFRSSTWKKVSLSTNIDAHTNETPAQNGIEPGVHLTTSTRLAPKGMARTETGVLVEVHSLDGLIDPGSEVEVVFVEADKISVKQLKNQ